MADAVTATTVIDGPKSVVIYCTNTSDGPGAAAVTKVDVSELSALGAEAALTDYVVIQDVTDDSSKKVLVHNLPATWG